MTEEPGKTTSVKAIWSLVLGILGLTCLGCIAGVPAIICGHMALSQIKKAGGLLTGDGMAIAGLIMGYLSLAAMILVIPMVIAIAIPSFVKARAAAQRIVCFNNLRTIEKAMQQAAIAKSLAQDAVVTEADLTPYIENGKLPVCPESGLYTFGSVGARPTCNKHGSAEASGNEKDSEEASGSEAESD